MLPRSSAAFKMPEATPRLTRRGVHVLRQGDSVGHDGHGAAKAGDDGEDFREAFATRIDYSLRGRPDLA